MPPQRKNSIGRIQHPQCLKLDVGRLILRLQKLCENGCETFVYTEQEVWQEFNFIAKRREKMKNISHRLSEVVGVILGSDVRNMCCWGQNFVVLLYHAISQNTAISPVDTPAAEEYSCELPFSFLQSHKMFRWPPKHQTLIGADASSKTYANFQVSAILPILP